MTFLELLRGAAKMRMTCRNVTWVVGEVGYKISPSDKRVAIIISSHPNATLTMMTDEAATVSVGFNIHNDTVPLFLDIWRHGQAVQKGWIWTGEITPQTHGVIEVYCDEL